MCSRYWLVPTWGHNRSGRINREGRQVPWGEVRPQTVVVPCASESNSTRTEYPRVLRPRSEQLRIERGDSYPLWARGDSRAWTDARQAMKKRTPEMPQDLSRCLFNIEQFSLRPSVES